MKNKSLQQQLDWLEREKQKDELMLNIEKNQLISQIKKIKKEEVLPPKPKKLTLWQRIKKVLMP
jgi:hypothetical protein